MGKFYVSEECSRIYLPDPAQTITGIALYIIAEDSSFSEPEIEYQDALEKGDGHFLFGAFACEIELTQLVELIYKRIRSIEQPLRAIIWLVEPLLQDLEELPMLGFQSLALKEDTALQVTYGLEATIAPELGLAIDCGCKISFAEDQIIITPDREESLRFTGKRAVHTPSDRIHIPLSSTHCGCLCFDTEISAKDLSDTLQAGFRYGYATDESEAADTELKTIHYPFLALNENTDVSYPIRILLDISDPWNQSVSPLTGQTARTVFRLNHASCLPSNYMASCGVRILLRPASVFGEDSRKRFIKQWQSAGFVLQASRSHESEAPEDFHLTPIGDFRLEVNEYPIPFSLICGINGGESISFSQYIDLFDRNDILRFFPSQPAFSPIFPLQPGSPLNPPVDHERPLLDARQVTAWATIRGYRDTDPEADNAYQTQPKGAELYGKDNFIHDESPECMGPITPAINLPRSDEFAFPMVGHFCEYTAASEATLSFETEVLAKLRRKLILFHGQTTQPSQLTTVENKNKLGPQTESIRAMTLNGLIAEIAPDGSWNELALTKSPANPEKMLRFTQLSPQLQSVFQSSEPFAVIANSRYLGTQQQTPATGNDASSTFQNRISIGQWSFRIPPGQGNRYGSYQNILLIKLKRGLLRDLASTPDLWTEAEHLSLPEEDSNPAEFAVLSQWLQDYIDDAFASDDACYNKFKSIASDPNWTGVLALNLEIDTLPETLAGLIQGADKEHFRAHHLGITTNQIDPESLKFEDGNSLFALVDYCDTAFDPNGDEVTVSPQETYDYDFKLLQLQASFENSAIKHFSSRAQLSLKELFGDRVTGINARENYESSIPLVGSFQKQGNETTYSLDSEGAYQFFTKSPILPRIELSKAQFGTDKGDAVFHLWGFLDFAALDAIDLFSFGNASGETKPNVGLAFNGLCLRFPHAPELAPHFETTALAFDAGDSRSRPESLYSKFPLRIESLIMGCTDKNPADMGFLPVRIPQGFAGLSSGNQWNGITFGLDLGTPGDLAAAAGFRATLLLAWDSSKQSEDELLPVEVGIRLPGTSGGADGLSLQGALQLAIGDIELSAFPYGRDKRTIYLLKLEEIALSFLGLAKIPPTGATAFYLFVDPNAESNTGGLGWYAVYNKEAKNQDVLPDVIKDAIQSPTKAQVKGGLS